METKTIPFDLETAMKIQAGEVDGRITTKEGKDVRIICTDKASTDNENRTQIVCLIRIGARELVSIHDPNTGLCWDIEDGKAQHIIIEVPDIKAQFSTGDQVRIRPDSTHGIFVKGYDGCIGRIVGTHKKFFVVMVTGAFQAPFRADELELVEETGKHEFKTFDRVLVRDEDSANWKPVFYGYYDKENDPFSNICSDGFGWKQCIPYEGNEHLVGTTDKPKED